MRKNPRNTFFLVSRIVIALCALFSGLNLLFIHLGNGRLMPMALSMTGYLSKTGIQLATYNENLFFSVYGTALAGVVCAALLLCALMAGRKTGWLAAGVIIFLSDCAGMAMLILKNGYRGGYWFEICGHVVILAAFVAAFFTTSPKK